MLMLMLMLILMLILKTSWPRFPRALYHPLPYSPAPEHTSSSVVSTMGENSTPATTEATAAAAATAAIKPKKAKTKTKKKTKGRMKAKAKAPRLEGEALRDELMHREKREEARVLAVNTLFYRARAYNVSFAIQPPNAVCSVPGGRSDGEVLEKF